MNDEHGGRRLPDQASRWLTAFNAAVSSVALTMLLLFYANLPKELAALRESYAADMADLRAELRAVNRAQVDVNETLRSLIPLRDRVTIVEQRTERLAEQAVLHGRRLDRIEEPRGIFGSGGAKRQPQKE